MTKPTSAPSPFMLDDDTRALTDAVREICAEFSEEYWARCDADHRYPSEFVEVMGAGGWLGLMIQPEYGGGGQGVLQAAAVMREVSGSGAGFNGCVPMHMGMFATEPLARHGTDELRHALLPKIASGELRVAFAVTEPTAGLDTSRITTSARRTENGWKISGQKIWITMADVAHIAFLLARTSPAPPDDRFGGLSLFVVDMDPEYVSVRPIEKLAHNAVASCEVFFNDLPVDESRLIGEEGCGFRYMLDALNGERIVLGAEILGVGEAAIRRGVRYAGEREVFGQKIGVHQSISHPLARAHAHLGAAWLALQLAAWRYDNGMSSGAEANQAKYLAAEAAYDAADAALQTHGGMGFAREYHVERYFREARLLRVVPVSQEMMLNYIAHKVLGLPRGY